MIDGLALPLAVTVLFGASFATHVYILVAQDGPWTSTVERLLHIVMCAAMVVMAWPVGMELAPLGPIIFFLAATVWFMLVAALVFSGTAERLINGYHAIMMAAVAWLYAVMNGGLPGQHSHSPDHTMSSAPGVQMPGMNMSLSETAQPVWVTTVNWIATVGYATAAVYWLYRYFAQRKTNPALQRANLADLGLPCQAFMAAGMAVMFGAML
ncbi:hypothetical protein BST37_16985 [Mycobacterium noviomagense]|uniref:DUF5134 domain-containing protein n=1 Tax=Mycobacterium noviomagense TaxID=459858 RepID=A0ABX3T2Y4_9MYCO|nr:hypothetical protein BST37_16985 [Mycobacterium noviomagense]